MKKLMLLVATLGLFTFGQAMAETKVGIIDLQRVSVESKAGKHLGQELQAIQKNSIDKLKAKESEIAKLQNELKKSGKSLSKDALEAKQMDIQRKSVELERLNKDLSAELQQKGMKSQQELTEQIVVVIRDYSVKNKFSLIIPKEVTLYNEDAIDVTSDIIKNFDVKWSKKGK